MNPVKFDRGTENRYGNRVYFSKCGLFAIEQRKYVLPFASVGYVLSVVQPAPANLPVIVPRRYRETDSLADAKNGAACLLEELSDDAQFGA